MAKYRAQILLEPEQHAVLVRLAEERQESISGVVREIVGGYLLEVEGRLQNERERQALHDLAVLRRKVEESHGMIAADWLEEARDERSREIPAGWGDA